MKIFFLDDMHTRQDAFLRHFIGSPHDIWSAFDVESAQTAFDKFGPFDVVFLDHDLNEADYLPESQQYEGAQRGPTGADMATWIARLPKERQPQLTVVHSMNPVGAERMCSILRDGGLAVRRWVFNPKEHPLKALGL